MIPKNASKVFSGVIFEVYQWEQEQFDGTYQTFEVIKRPDIVNILPINSEGNIILSRQEQPGVGEFIGCLGGRVDREESSLDAANRELLEESGLTAKTWELWFSTSISDKIRCTAYTYIAKDLEKVDVPHLDAGEKIKTFKVTVDKYFELVSQKDYRDKEISLHIFQLSKSPEQLIKAKQLFDLKTK